MNNKQTYTFTAIRLHWLIALLILGAFIIGHVMSDMPGFTPTKLRYFSWHKWTGVTIFLLSFIRLVWRVTHRPPEMLPMPAWQAMAAHGTHIMLYLLMFAVPLTGYCYSLAAGVPVVYFGVLPLPVFMDKNEELKVLFKTAHILLNYTMAGLVVLHALGALKHHFVEKDGTLARMLPFLK